MRIKVLGSAAGGGFPQWNCNGSNSRDVRRGLPGLQLRTQSSLAVSANGRDWLLLNASPDIRQQIANTPQLHPRIDGPARNSPIKAVVLTNGDIDHIAGLLSLRESEQFSLYAAQRVLSALEGNSVFNVLNPQFVTRHQFQLGAPFEPHCNGSALGLSIEAFAVPGKVALYLEDDSAGDNFGTEEGDTVGLKVIDSDSGRHFFYIPGCAGLDETLAGRLRGAGLLFFDGTLFTDDEMVVQGLSAKTGQRMGHMSMSGPDGTLAAFDELNIARKIFIHINNSNPVLRENSAARAEVTAAGWEVAFDGMEVTL